MKVQEINTKVQNCSILFQSFTFHSQQESHFHKVSFLTILSNQNLSLPPDFVQNGSVRQLVTIEVGGTLLHVRCRAILGVYLH